MATITALARTSPDQLSFSVNGRWEKSTEATFSMIVRVPKRTACAFIRSISSCPPTGSGNPGKFSISVVYMS